jgi:hypothetical protein
MANDNQFLVMGAAEAHALVEKNLASGRVHLDAQMPVFLGAESEPVGVGPPEESFDVGASPSACGQD